MKKKLSGICRKKLYLNTDFVKNTNGDNTVFLNYKTGNWIEIDKVGYEIAKKISDSTIKKCISDIAKDTGNDYKDVLRLYKESIITMLKVGFLIQEESNKYEKRIQTDKKVFFEQIWIHVTDTCNLSCPYCYFKARNLLDEGKATCIDYMALKKFLTTIPIKHRKRIVISGGEPFLNKDLALFARILKVKMKFLSIKIITNGTVGHNIYRQLSPYVREIQFSLDGVRKETHENNRGKGTFEKTIAGIKQAVSSGFKNVIISFAVTERNIEELLEIPLFVKSMNVHAVHINRIIRTGKNIDARIGGFFESFDEYYKKFLQMVNDLKKDGYLIHVSNSFEMTEKIKIGGKVISCGMGKNIISIVPNGDIYPCPSLHYDEYKLGSINDRIKKIISAGYVFNMEHNVENEHTACYSCKYKYFCGGGCRAEALAEGDINGLMERCGNMHDDIIRGICCSN